MMNIVQGSSDQHGDGARGGAENRGGAEASAGAGSAFRVRIPLDLDLEGYGPAVDDPSAYLLRQASIHQQQDQHQHDHHLHHVTLPHTAGGGTFGRLSATQPQQHHAGGGQFGILAPPAPPMVDSLADGAPSNNGQPSSGVIVPDPPDLPAWRERLFNVNDLMVLTDEQYQTYFPHIDNVYSHRSTQRYKRQSFVSHYWDCRMKGRPPGTPKSDDPGKKKRKRQARERDLCDVKIKITEYAPGTQIQLEPTMGSGSGSGSTVVAGIHPMAATLSSTMTATDPPPEIGPQQRFWTIQRVNGNGGNGRGDGVAGPHRHTLAQSDEIKKSSVQRYLAQEQRDRKRKGLKDKERRQQKQQRQQRQQQPDQRKATGNALATIKRRVKERDLKLYAACFCPYSQRVWIALEAKGMAYQYCETDPYRRPVSTQLLEANPRGLVPAIRQGGWACAESAILLEYLEDLSGTVPLYPSDPQLKANCRLWINHVNSLIVPAFFSVLQLTDGGGDAALRAHAVSRLESSIASLVHAADERGPLFLGSTLSIVDVHFAPFAIRLSRMLGPLCDWAEPAPGTRWHRWLAALESNPPVKATTSDPELYVETAHLLVRKASQ